MTIEENPLTFSTLFLEFSGYNSQALSQGIKYI